MIAGFPILYLKNGTDWPAMLSINSEWGVVSYKTRAWQIAFSVLSKVSRMLVKYRVERYNIILVWFRSESRRFVVRCHVIGAGRARRCIEPEAWEQRKGAILATEGWREGGKRDCWREVKERESSNLGRKHMAQATCQINQSWPTIAAVHKRHILVTNCETERKGEKMLLCLPERLWINLLLYPFHVPSVCHGEFVRPLWAKELAPHQ